MGLGRENTCVDLNAIILLLIWCKILDNLARMLLQN